jgi:hypothetical protein
MKTIKILLIAVLFIGAYSASAQWTDAGAYQTTTDNIGIGTATAPSYLLHVNKNMTETAVVVQNTGGAGGSAFRMIDNLSAADWKFKATNLGGFKIRDQASSLDVFTIEKNAMNNSLYIKAGGFVGIGTINPQSALAVNGKITCKEVEVTLTGWPDYVFEKEYKLSPLSEVEKYIKENNHLPGIPTSKEVIENGLSVGEMNVKMMEKIEELTLYVIQLQKEIEVLKNK